MRVINKTYSLELDVVELLKRISAAERYRPLSHIMCDAIRHYAKEKHPRLPKAPVKQ